MSMGARVLYVSLRRRYWSRLLNHFIGGGEQRRRNSKSKCFGGLEIDHQFKFGRRLNWEIGWLLALEDAIDVTGRPPELVDSIRPVGDQAAFGDVEPIAVNRGQLVPGRKCSDQFAMNRVPGARCHDQAAVRQAREGRDGTFDLGSVARSERPHLHAERLRGGLDGTKLTDSGRIGGISEDSHSRYARRDLLEEFQPFPAQTVFEIHKAGGVAARSGQGIDHASTDRIGDLHEHDRQGAGDVLQRRYARGATSQDYVRRKRDQFRCVFAIEIDIVRAPARVDSHIAAVAPAQLLQDLLERCDASLTAWIICGHVHEHADPPHLPRLLRPRRKGPRRYAAYKRDEFASPHGLPLRPTVEPYHDAE
jgi:hypothetical protein